MIIDQIMRHIFLSLFLNMIAFHTVQGQLVHYSVTPSPAVIRQQKTWGCWATAYTMMYSWKAGHSVSVEKALEAVNPFYVTLYDANQGILVDQKVKFIKDANLKEEAPQNFSAAGWEALLKKYGPIWVTSDETPGLQRKSIHARVLIGIDGDGSGENTALTFIDPATGRTRGEKLKDFLPKYESELRRIINELQGEDFPANQTLRIQVIHW